ncbi:kinesin-like protein KIF6 isoform X2 [Apis mellifera]|uniref:Kinesin-like protein KIF6 isoform X2 n=1 Tax=Apis mellifera TaxID=7460 RepID=A0A7M7ISK8_APIME|nr:kinesin-like protein KIF6 isoform X2 [Apis mellifera]|eukprot:XP_016769515.1 kinesin-like protein KIF6 isoform X2 [Apis mellifera]
MVKNAIKVYARLKPEKDKKNILDYEILYRPRKNLEEDFLILVSPIQKCKDYLDNRPESWNFSFYRIFEESSTQDEIFENVARPVIERALDGYNGTIFAYGQTASGKTHTITGSLENDGRGIIPRSLQFLFDAIGKRPENVYSIEVAYLEIYNETGYDLLDRRQPREFSVTRLEDLPRISIREDEVGRLHLKNLTFYCVKNIEDALELLLLGDNNRVTAETPMNPQSSRSHCIFTIVVSTKQFGAEQYKRAKVHLVDLAGNSLLTSILRDSLGGNCITAMLATLNITSFNLEETVSTCRFAQRVALIKNYLKLNLETDINSENALLRAENERLKQQIKALTMQTNEELTADDKRHLDRKIRDFLESDERICWDYNPKKVQYCFESFKQAFELGKDPKCYFKKLEYYKDLVVQRDKEISLLIDKLKDKERSTLDTSGNDFSIDKIKNNKKTEQSTTDNCIRNDKNETILRNDLALNDQNDKRESLVQNSSNISVPSKKLKRRFQKTVNRIKTNENISARDSPFRSKSTTQFNAVMPELLPCNIVNLNLDDLIENKNRPIERKTSETNDDETNQSSSRLIISEKPRKNVRNKRNTESRTKQQNNDDSSVELSSGKGRIVIEKDSSVETDYSTPVYEKFLSFNSSSSNGVNTPKSSIFEKDVKTKAERFDQKSDLGEESNKYFDDSLPLTGDPEIDEEIIAFYKAKRSGGIY